MVPLTYCSQENTLDQDLPLSSHHQGLLSFKVHCTVLLICWQREGWWLYLFTTWPLIKRTVLPRTWSSKMQQFSVHDRTRPVSTFLRAANYKFSKHGAKMYAFLFVFFGWRKNKDERSLINCIRNMHLLSHT